MRVMGKIYHHVAHNVLCQVNHILTLTLRIRRMKLRKLRRTRWTSYSEQQKTIEPKYLDIPEEVIHVASATVTGPHQHYKDDQTTSMLHEARIIVSHYTGPPKPTEIVFSGPYNLLLC